MRSSRVLPFALVVVTVMAIPAVAEERVVEAMAAWQSEGRLFKTGPQQALFVGAFSGIMFAANREGALDAARIVCPGLMEIDLESQAQVGEGRCIITDRDSDRVFARWMCAGVRQEGCQGTFTIIGGTGKFQGISGESSLLARGVLQEQIADVADQSVRETAAGIVVWPQFRYQIP